jgi:hypothetical protein
VGAGNGAAAPLARIAPVLVVSRRLSLTLLIVLVAVLFSGVGHLLIASLSPSRATGDAPPGTTPRSDDDGGFSIALSQPRDPYLIGRQAIAVDAAVPKGDAVAQIDFFLDGRLILTDRQAPYACEADFGEEIQRHTIIVTALTREGRRAKVSFVSRSADLPGTGDRPIVTLPVVVQDAQGRPVEGLSVSDFALYEDGVRQRIVHFAGGPSPQSIAVALHVPPSEGSAARRALLSGASVFVDSLPPYDALALLDAWRLAPPPPAPVVRPAVVRRTNPPAPAEPPARFSYLRTLFTRDLGEAVSAGGPAARPSLAVTLAAAAQSLQGRSGGRVLVMLVAAPPPPPEETDAAGGAAAAPVEPTPADPDLSEALIDLKRTHTSLQVVLYGTDPTAAPAAAALRQAAEESGGLFQTAREPRDVVTACRAISDALLSQYLLRFQPERGDRPSWHPIELRLRADQDLRVRSPGGYWSP